MTTLHLIRHGQTPNNVAGALDTALPGAGLTDLGMRQAEHLVRRFDGTPLDRVVSSAHRRAVLTAAPLTRARALEPLQDEGFGEVGAGDLEMMTTHESHMTYLTTVFDWSEGELDERMPGGPDGHSVLERYEAAIARRRRARGRRSGRRRQPRRRHPPLGDVAGVRHHAQGRRAQAPAQHRGRDARGTPG